MSALLDTDPEALQKIVSDGREVLQGLSDNKSKASNILAMLTADLIEVGGFAEDCAELRSLVTALKKGLVVQSTKVDYAIRLGFEELWCLGNLQSAQKRNSGGGQRTIQAFMLNRQEQQRDEQRGSADDADIAQQGETLGGRWAKDAVSQPVEAGEVQDLQKHAVGARKADRVGIVVDESGSSQGPRDARFCLELRERCAEGNVDGVWERLNAWAECGHVVDPALLDTVVGWTNATAKREGRRQVPQMALQNPSQMEPDGTPVTKGCSSTERRPVAPILSMRMLSEKAHGRGCGHSHPGAMRSPAGAPKPDGANLADQARELVPQP